jgi:hypothetical protein
MQALPFTLSEDSWVNYDAWICDNAECRKKVWSTVPHEEVTKQIETEQGLGTV